MATLLPEGKQSFNNSAGAPLVGGKVYTYDAGTSTPRTTYSDAAATVPNTNPVVLDARGEATIFWAGAYKVILKDAADVTIWTVDNITSADIVDIGAQPKFSASVATSIGGYPVGYVLQDNAGLNSYVNIVAANVTDFNTTPASIGVSWIPYAGQTATQSGSSMSAVATGTVDAITAAYAPTLTTFTNGIVLRFRPTGVNTSTTPTFSPNGLTAKTIVKGANQPLLAGDIAGVAAWAEVQYDLTLDKWVLINPATGITGTVQVPVRQTVLSGPVDTSGFSAFGGATGSSTVTGAGTLRATAANGYGGLGAVDYTGSITNPSWTGLSTNGTMFLFLDIAPDGTCTTGSTTLAPTYRWGGADVTASGQFTFNIQEMVGKVGNGATAVQTYRLFVGEVTVAGSVVTAITWYALMGRYQQAWVSTLPAAGVAVNANHNIGTVDLTAKLEVQNITAEFGFVAGDTVTDVNGNTGGVAAPISIYRTAKTVGFTNTNTGTMLVLNKTTGANATMTLANWKYRLIAQRSW